MSVVSIRNSYLYGNLELFVLLLELLGLGQGARDGEGGQQHRLRVLDPTHHLQDVGKVEFWWIFETNLRIFDTYLRIQRQIA